MEPLSIIIDVENYKIGIDASPKRAVDYSMRNKLKRPVVEATGPPPKMVRIEPERTVVPEDAKVVYVRKSPEKSAFRRVTEKISVYPEKKLTIPESIPTPVERPSVERRIVLSPDMPVLPRTVISHTAASLAQSSSSRAQEQRVEVREVDPNSRSPGKGTTSSEMWRPW